MTKKKRNSINRENRPLWREPIVIAAIITALSGIIVALINAYAPDFIPRLLHRPTVSISSVSSAQSPGKLIDKNFAPYDVLVSGIVLNADGKYLYLIVVDAGGEKWVQPRVGLISGDEYSFSGHSYLGDSPDSPPAQNQPFIIYAVVSDNGTYQKNDDVRALATSESIILVRRDSPTPTP